MKKKKIRSYDPTALNSKLLRRPIQRCFPIFILPALVAFCIGFLYPFIMGLYRSFCKFTSPVDFHWNGIENYVKAFHDKGFMNAFGFTTIGFTEYAIAMGLAVLVIPVVEIVKAIQRAVSKH